VKGRFVKKAELRDSGSGFGSESESDNKGEGEGEGEGEDEDNEWAVGRVQGESDLRGGEGNGSKPASSEKDTVSFAVPISVNEPSEKASVVSIDGNDSVPPTKRMRRHSIAY
jgi:hypothetical protein